MIVSEFLCLALADNGLQWYDCATFHEYGEVFHVCSLFSIKRLLNYLQQLWIDDCLSLNMSAGIFWVLIETNNGRFFARAKQKSDGYLLI